MRSCGISRTTSTISSIMTGHTPRSQIRPQVFDQHLKIILCRHTVHPHGEPVLDKCCTIGISTICSRGRSCIPGTCFELSSPASHRLDAITEDHHSCAHCSISFQNITPAHFVKEQDSGISRTFASDSPDYTISVFDLLVSSSSR